MNQGAESGKGQGLAARGLYPQTSVPRSLRLPGSKSLAIRALLMAAVARGQTRLLGQLEGEDVNACLDVLRSAGISVVEQSAEELLVSGRSVADGKAWLAEAPAPCGESGTLARLTSAILGLCGTLEQTQRVEVSGSLLQRSSPALFEALRDCGVGVDGAQDGSAWPVNLMPARPPQTVLLQNPSSSQELSALLLALAAQKSGPRGFSVLVMGGLPSSPYATMTARLLQDFGAEVQATGAEWCVRGPLVAPAIALRVETDASAAAVALAAGCLRNQEVRVPGFNAESLQGDVRILEWLEAFGCEVERTPGELVARGFPQRPVELDLEATPDLAPVVAALAGALSLRAGASAGTSRLTGLETLNGKESRRVEVLAEGLRRLGIDVQADESSLTIGASRGLQPAAEAECFLDPHGDHRMAFAFGLLGLVRENLWVTDPGCVAKSWPGFWDALGARTHGA